MKMKSERKYLVAKKKKEGISESLAALSNRDSISRGNQVNNSLPEETVSAS